MIGVNDVAIRVERLEKLTRRLAREITLWQKGQDPLLYLERRAYLNALQDGLAGLEAARVVLSAATVRLATPNSAGESPSPT
ncbi:MAG: hypothetical protein ACKO23_09735 [Gemmataceae bacterium]